MAPLCDCRNPFARLNIIDMQHAIPSSEVKALSRIPLEKSIWRRLIADDDGQDLIEYALLAALVGLGGVLSVKGLSNKIANTFNSVGSSLTNAV
jgi:pilus assembly protein Flp/PilA